MNSTTFEQWRQRPRPLTGQNVEPPNMSKFSLQYVLLRNQSICEFRRTEPLSPIVAVHPWRSGSRRNSIRCHMLASIQAEILAFQQTNASRKLAAEQELITARTALREAVVAADADAQGVAVSLCARRG